MKKLVVPIVIALLIVAGIVAATYFWVIPELETYTQKKADAMLQAGEELQKVVDKHEKNLTVKFDDPLSSTETNRLSGAAIQDMVESGVMTYDNPDVHTLMRELKRRLEAVQRREDRVAKIEKELQINWSELSGLTNEIAQARMDLSNQLTNAVDLIKRTEENAYKTQAQLLSALLPAQAVISLRQKDDPKECAKLFFFMKLEEQAALITELNNGTEEDQKLSAGILQEFKRIGLEPAVEPEPPAAAQPPN